MGDIFSTLKHAQVKRPYFSYSLLDHDWPEKGPKVSEPPPTMHVAKQRHRKAKGPDSMILQRVDEIGIAKKRKLLEKLKALIAKKMDGACACR